MTKNTLTTALLCRAFATLLTLTFLLGMASPIPARAQASQDDAKQSFDIPAGEARPMLRQFAAESKREIIFEVSNVAGINTKAVKGEFTAREALDIMLSDTGLVATLDSKSGAIAVRKGEAPNAQGAVLAENSNRPSQSQGGELGTGTISGTIVRPAGGNSVKGLLVTVVETGQTDTTDTFGRFSIIGVAPGTYTLAVSGNGYPTLDIKGVVAHSHTEEKLAGQVMPMAGVSGVAGETTVVAMSESEVVELEKYEVMDRKPFVDENMDIVRTENDVQPYYIINSQQIDASGATNIEDLLKQQLAMNTEFSTLSQFSGSAYGNTSSINLRGLGTNETLILVDGRRSAGVFSGPGSTLAQPDLNGIPLAAVDRIEVLPSSASAIYGGAAVGGVVNVILKKNYQGGQISYTYDSPMDADAPLRRLDATYGFSLEGGKTHVMLSGSYTDGKPLLLGERAGAIEGYIATIVKNEPAFFITPSAPFPGATPNIASADGSNLVLKNGTPLNSPITFVPAGTAPGSANLATGLLADAGAYNLNPANGFGQYGLNSNLGGPTQSRIKTFMATVRREMTPFLEVFAEFSNASNIAFGNGNPFNQPYQGVVVPASAPDNPFQQDVTLNIPSALPGHYFSENETRSLTAGFLAHLPHEWTSELDYTWSQDLLNYVATNYAEDSASLNADLASGAINPFADTLAYPLNLAPYLTPQNLTGNSSVNDLGLRASGPAWSFPWGSPTVTVGLEHRKEGNGDSHWFTIFPLTPVNNQNFIYFGQSQSTDSAYLEAEVPLVTAKNALPLLRSLGLQLAGRTEDYSVGSGTPDAYIMPVAYQIYNPPQGVHQTTRYTSSNPTIGLKYQPVEDVTFRVSYAKAFLPPSYSQLLPNPMLNPSYGQTIYDPKTGQTYSSYQTISGGNPDLKPQTSADWDFGVIWEPKQEFLKGLRIDLEYYKITQPNYITTPSAQQIVSDPAYASRVTRDPATGLITVIDTSYVNAEEYKTAGWDISLGYRKPTALGTFDLHAVATVVEKDDRQYTIGSPFLNYVGFPGEGGEAKTKANATLAWERKQWTVGWTTTYYGSYKLFGTAGDPFTIQYFNGAPYPYYTDATGSDTVPSRIYHQIFASYAFGKTWGGGASGWARNLLSNVTIQAGIKNLFNKLPPLDPGGATAFYYSTYGDIRLRDYTVSVRKEF